MKPDWPSKRANFQRPKCRVFRASMIVEPKDVQTSNMMNNKCKASFPNHHAVQVDWTSLPPFAEDAWHETRVAELRHSEVGLDRVPAVMLEGMCENLWRRRSDNQMPSISWFDMRVLSLLHLFGYIWSLKRTVFLHLSTVHDFCATENSIPSFAPSVYAWAKYQRINCFYWNTVSILNVIDFAEVSCFPFCSTKGHHCLFLSPCSLIIHNHRYGCTWGIVAQLFGCKTWESSTSGDAQNCRYYIHSIDAAY